jgi:DNA-binding transcriptional regulator YhcF (GntR family)
MAKKHDDARKDRYFVLHHYMLKTDAWRALSAPARAVYVQIGFRYNGCNNGRIAFSVRDAATECNLAKGTASRAFKELVDLGFIQETRHGGLSRKTRIASEWRMTAFKCDLTGALKTCLFMQRTEAARTRRLSQTRASACPKRGPRVSQKTTQPVPNEVQ